MSENLNICNRKVMDHLAPTPQNTPAGNNISIVSRSNMSSASAAPAVLSAKDDREDPPASVHSASSRTPGLVSAMQGKLGSLAGQSSSFIESLPLSVRVRIEGLQGLQAQHSKLEVQFQNEILELEKKYHDLCSPLYHRRSAIVAGAVEPTNDEIQAGREFGKVYHTDNKKCDFGNKNRGLNEEVKGIPQFWLIAMKNFSSLAEIITPEDEKALCYLEDIRLSYLDKPGFRLEFYFADNEFFSNKIISKTYYYRSELGYGGDFVYDHAEGDKIDWKADKDLTTRLEVKKQRNKNTRQTRVVKKVVQTESFFRFFSPPVIPDFQNDDDDDDDSDIDDRLEADYQVGEDIKEKLIPRAIDWFTGAALAYEDEYSDGSDQDYTDEDGDDDDDDDDDDDNDNDNNLDCKDDNRAMQDPAECRQS